MQCCIDQDARGTRRRRYVGQTSSSAVQCVHVRYVCSHYIIHLCTQNNIDRLCIIRLLTEFPAQRSMFEFPVISSYNHSLQLLHGVFRISVRANHEHPAVIQRGTQFEPVTALSGIKITLLCAVQIVEIKQSSYLFAIRYLCAVCMCARRRSDFFCQVNARAPTTTYKIFASAFRQLCRLSIIITMAQPNKL